MKKPVALIFGHRGGIGSAAKSAFLKAGYRIIPVDRTIIDFDRPDADAQINSLLTNGQPDVIVNATGVFRNGWQQDHVETIQRFVNLFTYLPGAVQDGNLVDF